MLICVTLNQTYRHWALVRASADFEPFLMYGASVNGELYVNVNTGGTGNNIDRFTYQGAYRCSQLQ